MSETIKKTALYEVWKTFGFIERIVNPKTILSFLEKSIKATNGKLNVDFYGGGFADELCSVKLIEETFYFYWKDFEGYFSDDSDITETERMSFQVFGNNTYIYQVMSINSLVIMESKGEVFIVVRCNYTTKKEHYSNLINVFDLNKESIIELESGHYVEYLFKDSNGHNHSCQLIPFPINSIMIQEKNKPLDESLSKVIMDLVFINEFKELYNIWINELNTLQDYNDGRKLKNLGSEIRLESERLLKYYILCNYNDMDYDEFEKVCGEILLKYSHLKLGDLKKKISTIDIPNKFIIILNTLAHDSGKIPLKDDLKFVLNNFKSILEENFELLQ